MLYNEGLFTRAEMTLSYVDPICKTKDLTSETVKPRLRQLTKSK